MKRTELIRIFVLNAMVDDYESFEQISKDIARDNERCGITANRSDILDALTTLIKDGLVQAYRYSGPPRNEFDKIQGVPPLDEIDNPWYSYFFVTKKGREVHSATEDWPFDDDYVLRADWTPPED